jgi:hypothetical protein
MIELYWNIGRSIRDRQADEPWGSRVLDRRAKGLKSEFALIKGFFRTNLYNKRTFRGGVGWLGSMCADTAETIEMPPWMWCGSRR